LGLGAALVLGAWSLGVPILQATWLGAAAALAMWCERLATRREVSVALQVNSRAANREGQREAVAQLMSLEMSYERSRSVLEALREGVVVVDGQGEVVLANPAARRTLKNPAQDPEGRILWEVLTPELARCSRDAWSALHDTTADTPATLPQIRYSAIPCRDNVYDLTAVEAKSLRTGQDFGSVFLLVDSTRSHELQRLKDRFLSSVSHELRTPLTNICAYAEILNSMMPGESVEWPEFVRVIHEEGLQLSRLVDGMFDFLQLESGEAQFAHDEIDGGEVVREACARYRPIAEQRNIDVQCSIGDAPRLVGDHRRLVQVVGHLLDNAVKFTPADGRVVVALGCRDDGWELRIDDSGPGVPPGDRNAVFEKFHQLRDHLTDKPNGTGLGLATSRAIVARFGGLIWCEDSPLGGAAFVVLLPAVGQPRLAIAGTAGGGF
jgi:signal transduction histidine kinase